MTTANDIPEFDGEGPTTLREFKFRVRGYLKKNPHISNERGREEIARHLSGVALEHYRSLYAIETMTPSEVLLSLSDAFHHTAEEIPILPPVYAQAEDGEPVINYKVAVEREAREQYPRGHPFRADFNRLLMGLFIGGLKDYLREHVILEGPETYEEAFKHAQHWESLEKASLAAIRVKTGTTPTVVPEAKLGYQSKTDRNAWPPWAARNNDAIKGWDKPPAPRATAGAADSVTTSEQSVIVEDEAGPRSITAAPAPSSYMLTQARQEAAWGQQRHFLGVTAGTLPAPAPTHLQ